MDLDTGKPTEINSKKTTFWRITRTVLYALPSLPVLTTGRFLVYRHTATRTAVATSKTSSWLSKQLRVTACSTRPSRPSGAGAGKPSGPRAARRTAQSPEPCVSLDPAGSRSGAADPARGLTSGRTRRDCRPASCTPPRGSAERTEMSGPGSERSPPAAHRPQPGPTWSSTVPGPTRTVTRRPLGANTDTAAPPPPAAAIFPPGEEPRCARPTPPPGTSGACGGQTALPRPRGRARRELEGSSPGSAGLRARPLLRTAAPRMTARKRRRCARSSAPSAALRARPFG